jgi:4-oxalocrotonate tautomerase
MAAKPVGAWWDHFWSVAMSETSRVRMVLPSGALSCAILLVSSRRETKMPEIYVHAVKGRTLDQKRALVKDITDAVVKNFSVPLEAVTVEIVETEPTAKAKGGVLFSEMRR